MSFWRKTLLISLVSFSSLTLLSYHHSPSAHAQTTPVPNQGLSLQISPLPIELTTKPGTSISTELRVRNTGAKTEVLQVKLLKVTEDNNGGVHLTKPGPNDEWVNWITFSRKVFVAPSNEWQSIDMTVDVPSNAAFGYYFAVEYLRAVEATPKPGQTLAKGAVATFVLLNADAPGAKRQAEVTSFTADRKNYEFLPATFTAKIKNTGNVHVAPSGNVFINQGKKLISSVPINMVQGNVLPNSSRYFTTAWTDGFPIYISSTSSGKDKTTLKWDFSHANRLRWGHFKANLYMVYDDGTRDVPLQASVSFWVIPWRIIGVSFIVLIFMGIGLWSTFKKFGKSVSKNVKRASKKSGNDKQT